MSLDVHFDEKLLKQYAAKYIWWSTPGETGSRSERFVAQVMELGDYDDVQIVAQEVGDEYLKEVLTHAEPGQFSGKSWTYWHYRLKLAKPGHVPPLPKRKLP